MRTIATAAMVALAMGSAAANAADYGIGVSVQSDDALVYAPVDFNGKFRLEPSVRYIKNEFDSIGGEAEQEQLEVGIGLFGLGAVNKSVRIYYGGRVSYIDQENLQPVTVLLPGDGTLIRRNSTSDADGYRISPTIGFEFLFNERLSLGGEAEYFFQDVEGDGVDTQTSGTDTRLILRFKF